MFTRFARPVEIALGALFILSAASKALNVYGFAVQIAAYGIVRDPSMTLAIAYFMTSLEALLGVAMLAGLRFGGLTILVTSALLVGFTGLIAYAWAFKGLADCGCFGDLVKMGPAASIAKNIVLLAMAAAVWLGARKKTAPDGAETVVEEDRRGLGPARIALASVGVLVVAIAFASGKPAPKRVDNSDTPRSDATNDKHANAPFAEYVPRMGGAPVALAQGEYFVAMLSASCDHCRAAAKLLNDLSQEPGVPQIAALMMGTEDEMTDFETATDPQFPIQTIDTLKFMDLLGDATSPPCFYVIRDGKEVRHLIEQDPSKDTLLAFATQGGAPPAKDK